MPTKFYAIPIAILLVALLGSYFALQRDDERRKGLLSETVARVTNTDVRRMKDPETSKELTVDILVTYEFEISGVRYERSTRKSKVESARFVPWGEAKVCYDDTVAGSRENAELFPKDHVCGN